jgi:putative tryptophan/tyrosine transport system substrate-binding protein
VRLTRRRFVAGAGAAGLGLLVSCSQQALPGQHAEKVYHVGVLGDQSTDPAEARLWQAFRLGLQEFGWSEGRNLVIESRWVEGDPARLPELAAALVQLQPDVITTRASLFTQAAKEATSSIPIVFIAHADPVGTGHVASLARPGGNLTGVALLQTELGTKGLELLSAAVPGTQRIAVLWHIGTPSHTPGLKALEEAGRRLLVQLQPVGVRTGVELEDAFRGMSREGAQAILLLATPFFFTERQRIAELAMTYGLPAMLQGRDYVVAGGLMSYYVNLDAIWRRAAYHVDRILRGTKPTDLPVEQPMTFDFVVNMKTARALGITFPPEILLQVTEVIE